MPPFLSLPFNAPSTVKTLHTAGVKRLSILASSDEDNSDNSLPELSQYLTQAPATSCADLNGTPSRTNQSAISVANEKPSGADSAIFAVLNVYLCRKMYFQD